MITAEHHLDGRPHEPLARTAARIAGVQHGVAGREQLLAAGWTGHQIRYQVKTGYLHPIFHHVYGVGHRALSPLGHRIAAVLACGPEAALARFGAAASWELDEDRPSGPIDVVRPPPRRRGQPGIRLHRTDSLRASDVVVLRGIRTTTPGRTLLDLAAHVTPERLRSMTDEARLRRLIDPAALLARAAGLPGASALREALADEPSFTRSEAERRMLTLISRAGLPRPETNARVEGIEVDAVWRQERLVVEVDGFRFHGGRAAFERDRLRDATLGARGYRVLRVTWRQLTEAPEACLARLAGALALAAAPG